MENKKYVFKFVDYVDRYPPVICGNEINIYFPWLTKQSMANHNLAGTGPRGSFKCGRSRLYPTLQLLEWLDERVKQTQEYDRKPKGIIAEQQAENNKVCTGRRRGRKTKTQEVQERRG